MSQPQLFSAYPNCALNFWWLENLLGYPMTNYFHWTVILLPNCHLFLLLNFLLLQFYFFFNISLPQLFSTFSSTTSIFLGISKWLLVFLSYNLIHFQLTAIPLVMVVQTDDLCFNCNADTTIHIPKQLYSTTLQKYNYSWRCHPHQEWMIAREILWLEGARAKMSAIFTVRV